MELTWKNQYKRPYSIQNNRVASVLQHTPLNMKATVFSVCALAFLWATVTHAASEPTEAPGLIERVFGPLLEALDPLIQIFSQTIETVIPIKGVVEILSQIWDLIVDTVGQIFDGIAGNASIR
ncbi:hypothetical protein JTB14_037024 [Gonioctena quinquepunctata]|nr:hypothetical protein JTB14_037024 [Gonioctena quinquepunctata]